MAMVTVSVPDSLRKKMKQLNEVNWSAVSRRAFEERIKKEELLEQLHTEGKDIEWAVKLGRKAKRGRANKLRKLGYDL